jgi:hypothetical protein
MSVNSDGVPQERFRFIMEYIAGQIAVVHDSKDVDVIGIYSSNSGKGLTYIDMCNSLENEFKKKELTTKFKNSEIKYIIFPSATLNPPNAKKKVFTDTEISRGKFNKTGERVLTPFFSGAQSVELSHSKFVAESLSKKSSEALEWDQFSTNENLFNVQSSYTKDMYSAGLLYVYVLIFLVRDTKRYNRGRGTSGRVACSRDRKSEDNKKGENFYVLFLICWNRLC